MKIIIIASRNNQLVFRKERCETRKNLYLFEPLYLKALLQVFNLHPINILVQSMCVGFTFEMGHLWPTLRKEKLKCKGRGHFT